MITVTPSRSLATLGVANAADVLTAGQVVPGRLFNHDNNPPTNQGLHLTYFYADKTQSVANIATATRTTAAGATPTLCRMGVYSEAANGDLTLIGSTANDTTLFASTSATYTRALSAPYDQVLGQRYAAALLVVTAAALPTLVSWQNVPTGFGTSLNITTPKLCAVVAGQSDLPASISNASIGGSGTSFVFYLS